MTWDESQPMSPDVEDLRDTTSLAGKWRNLKHNVSAKTTQTVNELKNEYNGTTSQGPMTFASNGAAPVYLDDSGNPISAPGRVYLDPNTGEPIKSAAPQGDTRSLIQKAKAQFDALTTVTPEQRSGHGALVNAAQEFGAGAIQGLGAPFVHPLDTLSSIGTMIAHPIDSAKAMAQGVIDNPAKAAGNLVGGAVLGEAAAPIGQAAADVAGKAGSRALLLGKTPEAAYESAMKPSTTLTQVERSQLVRTALENKIPVSKGGVEKLHDRINTLNEAIKKEIASDPTRPIDPNAVATRTDLAKARFAKQVNAQPDLNAIEASRQQFLTEQGAKPGQPAIPPKPTGLLNAQGNPIMDAGTPAQPPKPAPPMNAADAQAMKQGTYRILKGKFGEQGSASVEAQKSLARGLKEEIAGQFPEIGTLNATESKLLDLQPVLERAVSRISNHQLIGIGTPVAGAAADAVAGPGVGRVAMVLKAVLDNPNVKSRLAISLSKSAKIPYSQAATRVAAYSSALGASVRAPQEYSSDGNPSQPTTPQP